MLNFDDKKFEEKTLAREEIFSGKIFHVVKDVVSLYDGQESLENLFFIMEEQRLHLFTTIR